jgi:D-alanyl-D-alanine carboxypeptidase
VPKVRRASRFVETEREVPSTAKLPVVDELVKDEQNEEIREAEAEEGATERTATKIMVSRPRRRPYEVYEPPSTPRPKSLKTQRPRVPRSESGTISTKRTHSPRERYVRYGRHEKRQRTRSLLEIVQDFRRNRTLVIIALSVAVLLILVPVLVNVVGNASHNSSGNLVTGTGQSSSSSSGATQGGSQQSADPHAIVITLTDSDHPAPPVYATSAYLLDADTGDTLYAQRPFMHLPMMSTTKLMTATLALEKGNLDQKVTINDATAKDLGTLSSDSSVMGIKKGETYTLRELMYGLILVSGNDAAIAIADTVGGNLPNFVKMMNDKAQSLGLLDTHYMNPHGLLATGHYSSAHDLAMLGRYAFNIPTLLTISGTRTYDVAKTNTHPDHNLINGDQFLWWYPGVNAGKPGWDGGSNFVQVVSCVRNGRHLIGVTMHTGDWWTDMRDLMNWGFNNFTWVSPHDVDQSNPIPYDNLWGYFDRDKKTDTIPIINGGRYYIYTGYSVSGPILAYFDKNGGLGKLGYPIGLLTASGGSLLNQKFEHATIQCDTTANSCRTI